MINLLAKLILINIAANQIAKECDKRVVSLASSTDLRDSNLLKSSNYAAIGRLNRTVLNKSNGIFLISTTLNPKNMR